MSDAQYQRVVSLSRTRGKFGTGPPAQRGLARTRSLQTAHALPRGLIAMRQANAVSQPRSALEPRRQ